MESSYQTLVPLQTFSPGQFLALAYAGAKAQGWEVGLLSQTGLVAFNGFPLEKDTEKITLYITPEHNIRIECRFLGIDRTNPSKNQLTVLDYTDLLRQLRDQKTPEEWTEEWDKLQPRLTPPEHDILHVKQPSPGKEVWRVLLSLLIPRQGYLVTPLLVYVNVLLFLLMVFSGVDAIDPSVDDLLAWGGNARLYTLDGQWWRLFSSVFEHAGFAHLLVNMTTLMTVGILAEPYLGKLRFLTAYLLTGLVASLASLWWHYTEVAVGASGAIFGIFGVFIAMLTTDVVEKPVRRTLLVNLVIFVAINLLYKEDGVDGAAHVGGFVSGFIIGYAYVPSLALDEPFQSRLKAVVLLLLTFIPTAVIFYHKMPNDMPKWYKAMESFESMDALALEVYPNTYYGGSDGETLDEEDMDFTQAQLDSMARILEPYLSEEERAELAQDSTFGEEEEYVDPKTPEEKKEELLAQINDRGIYYWEESVALLKEVESYDISDELLEYNKKLMRYAKLRLETYHLMYQDIYQDSKENRPKIDSLEMEIEPLEDWK